MFSSKVTAVVLAGGASTRMGQDKASLRLGNKTMLERIVGELQSIFENIIVVTNTPDKYEMLHNVKFVRDCLNMEERNSLVGLYSGLKQSETPNIFVLGCDMPFVNQHLIEYMVNSLKDEDIVIPFTNGYYEPLHAIYSRSCIPALEKLLQEKQYKITEMFTAVIVKKIIDEDIQKFDPSMACFKNINTYDEYLSLKDMFE